jgi:hypothetical protein
MTAVEGLGFLAAGLVLVTFCMKRVVPLRGAAITSNLAFILYGYIAGIEPVLVLHLILLPINVIRAGGSTRRQFTFRPLGSNSATSPPSTDSLARTP